MNAYYVYSYILNLALCNFTGYWPGGTYNILCFTESWLNNDNIDPQLPGYTMYRQDRTAASVRIGAADYVFL